MLFRGMLDAMDAWASKGVGAARQPHSAPGGWDAGAGRGVSRQVSRHPWQWPRRAGPSPLERLDFGPDFDKGLLVEPPKRTGQSYAVLVPAADADGNDKAGVRAPMVQAPLATYTGWNLRGAWLRPWRHVRVFRQHHSAAGNS